MLPLLAIIFPIIFFIIIAYWLGVLSTKRKYSKDFEDIFNVTKSLISNTAFPVTQKPKTLKADEIIKLLKSYLPLKMNLSRALKTHSQLMNIGSRLEQSSENVSVTIKEAFNILSELIGDSAGGYALFEMAVENLTVLEIKPSGDERLKNTLLHGVNELLANFTLKEQKGEVITVNQNNKHWELANYGIERSVVVVVPKSGNSQIILWVGLRKGVQTLSSEVKEILLNIGVQISVCLQTAKRMQSHRQKAEQEYVELLKISHDIRTPATNALNLVRSVLQGSARIDAEDRKDLEEAEGNILKQLNVLEDFLDIARKRNGQLRAEKHSIYIPSLLEQIQSDCKYVLESNNATLEVFDLSDKVVLFDTSHLIRILVNYIKNAALYAGGNIQVFTEDKGDYVEINVKDAGRGVSKEKREKIWEIFNRGEGSPSISGSGLGLSVCKELAELNGGYAFYRDVGGSIFGVGVKVSQIEKTSDIFQEAVLIVDDEASSCRALAKALKPLFSKILVATSVLEAVAIAKKESFNLMVSDYVIGDTLVEELLSSLNSLGLLKPVIVVTGLADEEKLQKLQEKFGVTIMEKPVRAVALQAQVKKMRT